jgi:CBS domain-containing protein
MVNIAETLAETSVSHLDLSRYVTVPPDSSVAKTVNTMSASGRSCALVAEDGDLIGIFTQRDVLLKVIGRPQTWDRQITEEMTSAVRTMRDDQSVADGLAIMNDWWVRSVPVVGSNNKLVGCLSFYTIMKTMADLLTSRVEDHAEPDVQDGLSFIDFTGLNIHPPVKVGLDESVEVAAHHMKARAIGSVLVADERDNLSGVLTEFDLQTKVGCDQPDLSSLSVQDVMTRDPVSLTARSSIADAIQEMAELGFSHIPLVGESGRPVGVASFRDISAYLETSLGALA